MIRTDTNPYEAEARQRKVARLVSVLAPQATAEQVSLMDLTGWKAAEALAGVRPAGIETRTAVIEVLRAADHQTKVKYADGPFAGFPRGTTV